MLLLLFTAILDIAMFAVCAVVAVLLFALGWWLGNKLMDLIGF